MWLETAGVLFGFTLFHPLTLVLRVEDELNLSISEVIQVRFPSLTVLLYGEMGGTRFNRREDILP